MNTLIPSVTKKEAIKAHRVKIQQLVQLGDRVVCHSNNSMRKDNVDVGAVHFTLDGGKKCQTIPLRREAEL